MKARRDLTSEREQATGFATTFIVVVVVVDIARPRFVSAISLRAAHGKEIHGAKMSRLCRILSTDPFSRGGASVLHDGRAVHVLEQLQQTGRL